MDRIEPDREPEEAEGAEQAFEALREEVAALRRGVELAYRQNQEVRAAATGPDYSPTLGVIAQELRAVGKRLDDIEGHPALTLTPTAYANQVTARGRQAVGRHRGAPGADAYTNGLRQPGDGGRAPGGGRSRA